MLAAMITHAAGESAAWNREIISGAARAVVLEAKDEDHIHEISDYLRESSIPYVSIVESKGEFANQTMALGVIPIEQEHVQEKLSEFQTLKALVPAQPRLAFVEVLS